MFQKFRVKQLRQWIFSGATWHWPLGTPRKLHTKHWFALNSSMQLLFGIPIRKLRLHRWRKCRGQLPGDLLAMEKYKYRRRYANPATNIRRTRASHESQYTRYLAYTYSEALKNSLFPTTIPVWNSLSSSVVSSKTPEEFKALI